MGSMPYRMCDVCKKKELGVHWGLVDSASPAFELRNSGVPAVARSFQLPLSTLRRPIKSASALVKPVTAYHWHAPAATPPGRLNSPDTTAVGVARLQARRRNQTHPPPGQSPAYTYLKRPYQPLQTFNQKIWPCKRPFLAEKSFSSPKLGPPTP
jgi:hypothetical protein